MDTNTAKHIGQQLAMKSAGVGLLIAYVLFGWVIYSWDQKLVHALFWIFDVEFWYHLLIGAIGLLTMAYYFGRQAGVEILMKRRNENFVGIKYGILTLVTGTLLGCSVGFFLEGLDDIGGMSNPFYDYYFKPLYWVMMFGIIPVIIVGMIFGKQIKRKGKKFDEQNANVNER